MECRQTTLDLKVNDIPGFVSSSREVEMTPPGNP